MVHFHDRIDAAERLAAALHPWGGHHPLILAIPRGAAPMGRIIADRLDGDLDVILTRKIGAPGQEELAIGAIGESGWSFVDPIAERIGVSAAYIEAAVAAQRALMAKRRALYTPDRNPIDPAGRIAIIVDDGLATGATMVAALHDARDRRPARLICAVPVASAEARERVAALADEVICLATPANFYAVGQFYGDFSQVSDEEVIAALTSSAGTRAA